MVNYFLLQKLCVVFVYFYWCELLIVCDLIYLSVCAFTLIQYYICYSVLLSVVLLYLVNNENEKNHVYYC